jgi:hypothetical protein
MIADNYTNDHHRDKGDAMARPNRHAIVTEAEPGVNECATMEIDGRFYTPTYYDVRPISPPPPGVVAYPSRLGVLWLVPSQHGRDKPLRIVG